MFLLFFLVYFANIGAPLASGSSTIDTPLPHQGSLPHTSLSIGGIDLDVELATDEASREKGLMNRNSLDPNKGMLFVFPRAKQVSFWMKETSLALSVAYINSKGRIMEFHDLEPFSEHLISSRSSNIVYVLEVTRHWFRDHNVLAGDLITGLPSPLMAQ
ncbi:MAG: DUF192 domain-containing protein [Verrucomicrobia bacterium]|jgi:uncharacterized protein|nr:MAG: DUF192 domain-containing protein [Verrucomicrobiota bacterium]